MADGDSENQAERTQWRRAHEAADQVRARLGALGIPAHETAKIRARTDLSGKGYVYVGTLSLDSADRLIAATAERERA